jgi:hypothetical protein
MDSRRSREIGEETGTENKIGVLGPRISPAEQRRDDCYQDRRDDDLRGKSEQKAPPCGGAKETTRCSAHDSEQDRHEAADGLHAGNQDSGDQADDDAGTETGKDAVDFHSSIQPLDG